MVVWCGGSNRLASDRELVRQNALGPGIEDGSKRKQNIVGGEGHAVGPGHTRSKMKGEGAPVRGGVPLFRQPRLQFKRGTVDSDKPSLSEETQKLGGLLARDDPIEGTGY